MSHHHCEIVIPPTDDIEASIRSVLAPFDESNDDDSSRHAFWDFWVIGGRWAGHKLMARYDQAKLAAFRVWLIAEEITVSSFTAGKEELQPKSQEPKVDAMWNEMFPSAVPVHCPLFKHSNDQYAKGLDGTLPEDVCRLVDIPSGLDCSRVIFAGPSYLDGVWAGPVEAKFMLCRSQWNGCNHMDIDWDGKLSSALEKHRARMGGYREEYAAAINPADDWLVVTVDYHS